MSTPAAKQQYSLGRVLVTMALGLSRLSCIANGASESHVNSFVPCTEYVRSKSEKIDINRFKNYTSSIDHQGSMPPVSLPINHYRVRVCIARLCVLFVRMYICIYFICMSNKKNRVFTALPLENLPLSAFYYFLPE